VKLTIHQQYPILDSSKIDFTYVLEGKLLLKLSCIKSGKEGQEIGSTKEVIIGFNEYLEQGRLAKICNLTH
jgi:hypothetical protein